MDATISHSECCGEAVGWLWFENISDWFEWNGQCWNWFVCRWLLLDFSKILSKRSTYLSISPCSPNRTLSINLVIPGLMTFLKLRQRLKWDIQSDRGSIWFHNKHDASTMGYCRKYGHCTAALWLSLQIGSILSWILY